MSMTLALSGDARSVANTEGMFQVFFSSPFDPSGERRDCRSFSAGFARIAFEATETTGPPPGSGKSRTTW